MLVEMNDFNFGEDKFYSPEPMDSTGGADEMSDEPALDEQDLEENDLTEEEADDIEWEQPEEGDEDVSDNEEDDLTV